MGGAVTGTKFYFFTDPTLLEPQTAAQAHGPAGISGSKDRFRVTDLHQRSSGSTADVPAFAICDGLLCAQADAGGTLSLILKPIEQPPFDFPFISYIIYKGIDPASLLISGNAGSGGKIDTSKAADNKLIDSAQKTWASNSNSGDPTRECLGLHLTPASTAADYPDLDLSKYAATAPLDSLFYQGDEKFQLPLVRGGWRIGDFAPTGFGLEIVVEHIGYLPKIALARKLENTIEVTSLDPNVTYQPDDASFFMHWHAKEECLNFVDPCALWGSFFATRLRVRDSTGTGFDRKTGIDIYEAVLRGAGDDTNATAGTFYNRNIVYFDIRNEHSKSFNYYKTNGDTILATFDPSAAIEASAQSYQSGGWPIFRTSQSMFPPSLAGPEATLRLSFDPGNYTRISIYGLAQAGRKKRTRSKLQMDYFLPEMSDGPELKFDLPVHGTGALRSISSYTSLVVYLFDKKSADEIDITRERCPWQVPEGIPFEAFAIPFQKTNTISLKTFSETYVLRIPYVAPLATSYNIGWISAGAQAVLLLSPAAADARDIGAPIPPYSANFADADLLDAIGRMIRPFTAVLKQNSAGSYYIDYSAPSSWTARIPRSAFQRLILVLSAQSLTSLRQAKGPDVAALAIRLQLTGDDARRLTGDATGLSTQDGKIATYSALLDLGAFSNVDAQ